MDEPKPKQDVTTITISGLPLDLLEEIDQLAKGDGRTRSNFVRQTLAEIVAKRLEGHRPQRLAA